MEVELLKNEKKVLDAIIESAQENNKKGAKANPNIQIIENGNIRVRRVEGIVIRHLRKKKSPVSEPLVYNAITQLKDIGILKFLEKKKLKGDSHAFSLYHLSKKIVDELNIIIVKKRKKEEDKNCFFGKDSGVRGFSIGAVKNILSTKRKEFEKWKKKMDKVNIEIEKLQKLIDAAEEVYPIIFKKKGSF